jgi:hydrogenase-4 component B
MLDTLLSQSGFFSIYAVLLAGGIGALLLRKNDHAANLWGNGLAILGSLLGLTFAVSALVTGTTLSFTYATSFPLLSLTFRIDPLSAFFIGVICLIAVLCSVYALGYVRHYYKKYDLGQLGFFYNIFIASMLLVVTAHHALFFLIAWEIMSLASYFLVVYERNEAKNIQAGTLYFVMTHIGTAFILLAFLLLYKATGSLDFTVIRNNAGSISPLVNGLVFVCALIGFGTKAGIIPLHIWLPAAHPAAPSHVSGLMSGVMIKTGIYMIIRMSFDILQGPPLW